MSGPPRKPTKVRRAEGNPGKLPINENEPEPPAGDLQCPDWLQGAGRGEWDKLIDMFAEMKSDGQEFITKADETALAAYCQAYSDLVEAVEKLNNPKIGSVFPIRSEGKYVKKPDGTTEYREGAIKYLQQTPWVAMKNKALIALRQYAAEFGFTPASRARVNLLPNTKRDEDEEEMFGA